MPSKRYAVCVTTFTMPIHTRVLNFCFLLPMFSSTLLSPDTLLELCIMTRGSHDQGRTSRDPHPSGGGGPSPSSSSSSTGAPEPGCCCCCCCCWERRNCCPSLDCVDTCCSTLCVCVGGRGGGERVCDCRSKCCFTQNYYTAHTHTYNTQHTMTHTPTHTCPVLSCL